MARTLKMVDPVDDEETQGPSSRIRPRPPCPIGYEIVDRLGSGMMGVVYRAEDILLGRPVALKLVDPLVAHDQDARVRFQKEARALAQVRHENVVQVYVCGEHEGSLYLTMELVEGRTLDFVIEEHRAQGRQVPLDRAAAIVRAVASGLKAVHRKNLVHRDVKPANIMLEAGTDRPVLIDFGLARRKSASNPKLSVTGGTPMYMAPEQARDADGTGVTASSDIYALACTAFELLTGRCVFEGQTVFEVLSAHFLRAAPAISSLRPALAPLDGVLGRALEKDPSRRYASCEEFIAAFDAAVAEIRSLSQRPAPPSSRYRCRPGVAVVAMAEGTRKVLARAARTAVGSGDEVLTAPTIEGLFARAADVDVDLVIVDEAAVSSIAHLMTKTMERWPRARVVIATHRFATPGVKDWFASFGVARVLPKPLNPQVSASILQKLVAPRDGAPALMSA